MSDNPTNGSGRLPQWLDMFTTQDSDLDDSCINSKLSSKIIGGKDAWETNQSQAPFGFLLFLKKV